LKKQKTEIKKLDEKTLNEIVVRRQALENLKSSINFVVQMAEKESNDYVAKKFQELKLDPKKQYRIGNDGSLLEIKYESVKKENEECSLENSKSCKIKKPNKNKK